MSKNAMMCFMLLSLCSTTALATTVTVPHTFVAGAPAVAADVNANFTALVNAINDLETRLGKQEGGALTAADIAGTYKAVFVESGTMGQSSAGGSGSFGSTSGGSESTVVMNANGTFTFSGSNKQTTTTVICSTTGQVTRPICGDGVNSQNDDNAADSGSGSWTLDSGGRSITLTPQGDSAINLQMSKAADMGVGLQVHTVTGTPTGRRFELLVFVKQ